MKNFRHFCSGNLKLVLSAGFGFILLGASAHADSSRSEKILNASVACKSGKYLVFVNEDDLSGRKDILRALDILASSPGFEITAVRSVVDPGPKGSRHRWFEATFSRSDFDSKKEADLAEANAIDALNHLNGVSARCVTTATGPASMPRPMPPTPGAISGSN